MKGLAQLTLAASLVAGLAEGHIHAHKHQLLHAKRNLAGSVAKRDVAVVEGPIVIQYELEGSTLDSDEAEAGIEAGLYSVVGETTPVFSPPLSPPPPAPSAPTQAAVFVEQVRKSTAAYSTTPAATPTPSAPSAPVTPSGKGLDAEFPSGKFPCSSLPTDYGATPLNQLGIKGWASIMQPGDKKWTPGETISTLSSAVSGGCTPLNFCSYACVNGYSKTQWPDSSQGSTGLSIGGLWCNADGFLELTRPNYKTLCQKGAGGVFVQNNLPGKSAICRTDYPGNEKMSIPLLTEPGGTYEITNPDATTSYFWKGSPTSAQYYVNLLDLDVDEACVWNSPSQPLSAGNWAPTNLGVGKDVHGITYLSIFPNAPTSSAVLDFDIEITGDVTTHCSLKGGVYSGGNNGCTTAISKPNGRATIVFSKGS